MKLCQAGLCIHIDQYSVTLTVWNEVLDLVSCSAVRNLCVRKREREGERERKKERRIHKRARSLVAS